MTAGKDTQAPARPVYVYNVPAGIANGITSVGLVQLSLQEDTLVMKRSAGDAIRYSHELALQSLWEVNGERVYVSDGSADAAMGRMDPQLRKLVQAAATKLNIPEQEHLDSFLNSQQVRV